MRSPRLFFVLLPGCVAVFTAASAVAADSYKLREEVTDTRVFRVSRQMEVSGTLHIQTPDRRTQPKEVSARAGIAYEERRLPGAGREAEALRSVRYYEQPKADIRTGDFKTLRTLRKSRGLIVVEGRREGIRPFSPAGPLTYEELDLLIAPGDSLGLLALLPDHPVEVGELWKPSDWVLQFLTGLEAVEKSALNCKLEQVQEQTARIQISGSIRGIDVGAKSALTLSGFVTYDLAAGHISHAELTQTDQRDAGVLHPARNITAKVVIGRTPVESPTQLTEERLKEQSLERNAGSLLLVFEQPDWGLRFHYDRQWHVFQQSPQVAILRLMSQGNMIAQCHIQPVEPPAAPGGHVPEEKFKAEIQGSLKEKFQQFAQAERVKTENGLYHYRVVALGGVQRRVQKIAGAETPKNTAAQGEPAAEMEIRFIPFQWIYSLLAAPDGRQATVMFVLESDQAKRFGVQDAVLLGTFEFLPK